MQFKYCSLVEIPWSGQLFEHRVQLVFKVASTLAFSNYIRIPNSRLRTTNTNCIHFWVIDESFKKFWFWEQRIHGNTVMLLHFYICLKFVRNLEVSETVYHEDLYIIILSSATFLSFVFFLRTAFSRKL